MSKPDGAFVWLNGTPRGHAPRRPGDPRREPGAAATAALVRPAGFAPAPPPAVPPAWCDAARVARALQAATRCAHAWRARRWRDLVSAAIAACRWLVRPERAVG